MGNKARVLVAGIGGASLGTEIIKCLRMSENYLIYGCDISPYSYGLYHGNCDGLFILDEKNYAANLLDLCKQENIQFLIAGGERPLNLISAKSTSFEGSGIKIVGNSQQVMTTCSNKAILFNELSRLNLSIPQTFAISESDDDRWKAIDKYPCVVKPAIDSGGSRFVFLADNESDCETYVKYVLRYAAIVLVQEYVPINEGEFTIGVLSLPDESLVGSVVMRRALDAKLSVAQATKNGIISSGYSQGLIDNYPDLSKQAENIAISINSRGPINIQARVKNGVLIPFEINPRFSASTYLRCMAGFNEIDLYLKFLIDGSKPQVSAIKPGYYLRSLEEIYVSREEIDRAQADKFGKVPLNIH